MHSEFTLNQFLNNNIEKLKKVSLNPEQEIVTLICYVFQRDKNWLYSNLEERLGANKKNTLKKLIEKRLKNIPLQYITSEAHFYNDTFYVTKDVLIPRPETEILIDESLKRINHLIDSNVNDEKLGSKIQVNLVEVGLGSGCIAISIVNSLIHQRIDTRRKIEINYTGTEISKNALFIASYNAEKILKNNRYTLEKIKSNIRNENYSSKFKSKNFEINLNFVFANTLKPLNLNDSKTLSKRNIDLLISNPPYIPSEEMSRLDESVKLEPTNALDGGEDGFEIIREIILESKNLMESKKNISGEYLFEIHSTNTDKLSNLLEKEFGIKDYKFIKDLTGRKRIINFKF